MKKHMALLGAVLGMVGVAGPALAHHGTGLYYGKDPVTMKGTVTEFEWANPHVQVYFDVKDDKGTVTHWACESLSPGKLARNGWSREAIKPGDAITITLMPSRSGAPVGNLVRVILPNGSTLGSRDDGPGGSAGGSQQQ
jgi:hypothetical protein